MPIVQFDNVTRTYTSGEHKLKALDRVSFSLDEGKFVVILGPDPHRCITRPFKDRGRIYDDRGVAVLRGSRRALVDDAPDVGIGFGAGPGHGGWPLVTELTLILDIRKLV